MRLATALAGLFVAAFCAIGATPAIPRPWKPTPDARAMDYAQIIDNRGGKELILLWWLAAPALPNVPAAAKDLLENYAVIGVVRAHISATATFTFDDIPTLEALSGGSTPLKPLTGDAIPPTVAGILTALEGSLRQALGATGQGIRWFVFDSGSLQACAKGSLAIPFAGETYTYETPIPGCPQN